MAEHPVPGEVEERTAPEGELTVEGRTLCGVIPYEQLSHDLGGWQEKFARGAFRNADTSKLVARVDHEGVPLGRYPGTLTLEDRDDGLHWSCPLPDSPLGETVRAAVARGDLGGTSHRFVCARDSWDGNVRTVHEVRDLRDVSAVTTPAYATRAELRSADHQHDEEEAKMPPEDEERTGGEQRPEEQEHEDRSEQQPRRGGGLRVEDRAARPEGVTVESRVLDAMKDVPAGEERDLTRVSAVPVEPQELSTYLWDLLRPSAVVLQSGVRTIDTSRKSVKWPTLTGDITASYVDELEAIPESDPEFDEFELPVAKGIKALVRASAEALEDSDPDLLTVITQNLGTILGLKLDSELIAGKGTSGQIRGLLNIAGIQEIDAAFTDLSDWSWYYRAAGKLAEAHVPGPYAVLMHTRVATGLALLKQFTSAESNVPLGRPSDVPAPFITSQLPLAAAKESKPVASDILVYAPRQVTVLRRVGVDAAQVLVDRSEEFSKDSVLIKGRVRAGLGTPYPQSIVRIKNVPSPVIS